MSTSVQLVVRRLSTRTLAAGVALLLGGPVLAQDDSAEDSADEGQSESADEGQSESAVQAAPETLAVTPESVGEEIIIYDEAEVQRRRNELEAVILDTGYRDGKRRGDRTLYRPRTPWKPTVVVHDEGLITLQRSPVRWMAPGKPENKLNNLWCLPPFTPMCVRIGGQIVATTKLDYQKGRVMEEVHDPGETWRNAIANRATWARVNEEVPTRLQATWTAGDPIEAGGPRLESMAQRRAGMLDFWASRADNAEGHMVAAVAADFLELEVQAGPHPVTAQEQAAANAKAAGVRRLDLPGIEAQVPPSPSPSPPSPEEPTPDPG